VANDRSKFRNAPAVPDPLTAAPPAARPRSSDLPSGRVQFDDRGNAVWEWAAGTANIDPATAAQRLNRLQNPSLEIVEEAPRPTGVIQSNPLGPVKGYNPYNSGKLEGKAQPPRKKDLKRLGEWIALRKQAARNKKDTRREE
jgi:hypothetical protein